MVRSRAFASSTSSSFRGELEARRNIGLGGSEDPPPPGRPGPAGVPDAIRSEPAAYGGPPAQSARTLRRQASKPSRTWSSVSPPNFSRNAAASSRPSTASPTTLAAGTEVMSERW